MKLDLHELLEANNKHKLERNALTLLLTMVDKGQALNSDLVRQAVDLAHTFQQACDEKTKLYPTFYKAGDPHLN